MPLAPWTSWLLPPTVIFQAASEALSNGWGWTDAVLLGSSNILTHAESWAVIENKFEKWYGCYSRLTSLISKRDDGMSSADISSSKELEQSHLKKSFWLYTLLTLLRGGTTAPGPNYPQLNSSCARTTSFWRSHPAPITPSAVLMCADTVGMGYVEMLGKRARCKFTLHAWGSLVATWLSVVLGKVRASSKKKCKKPASTQQQEPLLRLAMPPKLARQDCPSWPSTHLIW